MATFKTWMKAARPRTVLLSFSGILMGAFLAIAAGQCRPWVFVFAALTGVLLQIVSNLANDYGDFKKGLDSAGRIGPQRGMQSGAITDREMRVAIAVTGFITLLLGAVLVLFVSDLNKNGILVFLALGMLALLAALLYTLGKHPYGYYGLGDVFCFLFFGMVAVAGTYYLASHMVDWSIILPASAMGFLSNAVLNINNMRDVGNDRANGKRTLVVKIGSKNAFVYHVLLIVMAFLFLTLFLILHHTPWYTYLFWIVFPLFLHDLIGIKKTADLKQLDPYLGRQVRNTFFLTLAFGILVVL